MQKKSKIIRTAERYVLDRKFSQAVGEYKKLLQQHPNEPTLLNMVGDLLVKQGRDQDALEHFQRVAQIFLEGGFLLKAVAMNKKILQISPADLRAREALADLYKKQGLIFDACRELKFLTEKQEQSGNLDKALLYLKRLLEINPSDAELLKKRARMLVKNQQNEAACEEFVKAIRCYQQRGSPQEAYETGVEALAVDSQHQGILGVYVEAADQTGQLADCEAYLSRQIEATGIEFPYKLFLARIAEKKGNLDEAGQIYHGLQKEGHYDPEIAEGLVRTGWVDERKGHLDAVMVQLPQEPAEDEEPGEGTRERPLTVDLPEFFSLETPTPMAAEAETGEVKAAGEPVTQGSDIFTIETTADASATFSLDSSEPPVEQAMAQELAEEPVGMAEEETVTSLEEAVEEVDFYLKLGFQDDAKRLLQKLVLQFPDDDRVLQRASKVGIEPEPRAAPPKAPPVVAAAEPVAAPEPVTAPSELENEIETALEGLFSGEEGSDEVEEILRYDIGGGTESRDNNHVVHYDLGLAYKEMGLLEDATQEFLKAYQLIDEQEETPQRLLCCSMLANSYLQLGQYDEAVQWAQAGLGIPDQKEFERRALEYDLACALENKGAASQALEVFQRILGRDAQYRDVQDKVEQLQLDVNDQ